MSEINAIQKPDANASSAEQAAYRKQIVDALKHSGQTIAEFARAQGLDRKRLGAWKRQLEHSQSQPQKQKKSQKVKKSAMSARGKLNQLVTMTAPQAKNRPTDGKGDKAGKIELKHESGFTLGIDAKTDPALLKSLLKLLGELKPSAEK